MTTTNPQSPEPTYHEMFASPLGRASDAQQWADSAAGWARMYRDDAGPFAHKSRAVRAERCRSWDERAAHWASIARTHMGLTDLDQLYS